MELLNAPASYCLSFATRASELFGGMLVVMSAARRFRADGAHPEQSMDTTPYNAIQLHMMPPLMTQFNARLVVCHLI